MTIANIKNEVMFQTNNDADDVGDYLPALMNYINEGYDRILYELYGVHAGSDDYPMLKRDAEEPQIPEWMHQALADYATWMVYRNGNTQKQSRGQPFLRAFMDVATKIASMSDSEKADMLGEEGFEKKRYQKKFKNIPW